VKSAEKKTFLSFAKYIVVIGGEKKMTSLKKRKSGFTLIELLIVVAIIAILAAIAIPNFLQAQVRAKVSKTLADYQTLDTALEAYYVDNNSYISTRVPAPLTTPVAYITSLPITPWNDVWRWALTENPPEMDVQVHTYLIVTNNYFGNNAANFPGGDAPGAPASPNDPSSIDDDYLYYIGTLQGISSINSIDIQSILWEIKTQGPDGYDDVDVLHNPGDYPNVPAGFIAQLYDPSNGTVSWGDIAWFNDGTGSSRGH
jgi:prepilin-type N-terminal cleavage/methylation domain-containing protein